MPGSRYEYSVSGGTAEAMACRAQSRSAREPEAYGLINFFPGERRRSGEQFEQVRKRATDVFLYGETKNFRQGGAS
jgi:hypothetical protein